MFRVRHGVLLVAVLAAGCSDLGTSFPAGSGEQQSQAARSHVPFEVVPVTARNAAGLSPAPTAGGAATDLPLVGPWDYRVGAGDVLSVVVYDHPELTIPAGSQRTAVESGQPVSTGGTFFFPYVGNVQATGRTPAQIRVDLTQMLGKYIPDPQVDVHVAAFNSQSVSVTGEVTTPLREPLTVVPLTLLQAIDAAGGLKPDADTANVTVRRHGRLYTVNLKAFLDAGLARNNPVLQDGDVVNVPKMDLQQAFLLGRVSKPAPVDLSQVPVNLTAALSAQGGLTEPFANVRGVFVFRQQASGLIRVYQFDASSPFAYVAGSEFYLKPRDVVFVTTSPLGKWNEVMSSLLPFVTSLNQGAQAGTNL